MPCRALGDFAFKGGALGDRVLRAGSDLRETARRRRLSANGYIAFDALTSGEATSL